MIFGDRLGESIRRFRMLFSRRERFDRDMEEEMRLHRDLRTREFELSGASAEEARYAAQKKFGSTLRLREEIHRAWGRTWIDNLGQDIRYGLRMLRKSPIFTLVVVMTLSLGIGVTTAVFSVVDRILFRALPYAQADRIVSVGLVHSLEREEFTLGGFFFDWRDNQKPFARFASQGAGPHACDLIESNPIQLFCIGMQAGFLPLLGVHPALGRNFLSEEDRPNGPPVAIISYALWRSKFNRDPEILNRLINLGGNAVRVVGVLPEDFEPPTMQAADVFVPLALDEAHERNARPGSPMRTFARLKPGVNIAQATAGMEPLFFRAQKLLSIPKSISKDFHLSIRSLRDRETENVQLASWVLLGAVFAVLLIACANVASLMMARSAAREHELVVRSALGASRARLIRQNLTEAFLISVAGAAGGMFLAAALLRIFITLAPTGIPFLSKANLDLRIAVFTMLLSLACGAAFGLLPAFEKPRAMAMAVRSVNYGKRTALRRSLVIGQVAISMVLLCGAALLVRSFVNMQVQPLGIHTRGVVSATISLPSFRFDTGEKKMQFYRRVEAAIRQLPSVRAVAWTDSLPPGGWHDSRRFSDLAVAGRPLPSPGVGGTIVWRRITPDFFRALDIPILRGRNFSDMDRRSQQRAVMLSGLLAARLFPGSDPIGKTIQTPPGGPSYKVVGITDDVKNNGLSEPAAPEIYVLLRDFPEDWVGGGAPMLIADTVLPAKALVPWLRSSMAQLDSTVPVNIETLNKYVSKLADRPRFETTLLGFFAFTGLMLTIIGLYGVVAFMTAQRTKEIGVRMAIGASHLDILRLILREGLRLVAFGGAAGLIAALALVRVLRSLLFQVGPHDPASFITMTLLLVVVAIAATLIPARAAMRVEPVAALRHE
jgi:putative ABC transport system permease protein